jgi:tRNA(fMet)-specific endonuclease VapC
MAALIVDTGVLVDVERGRRHLDEVIADDDDVAIAAITFVELEVGVRLAETKPQLRQRRQFVDAILNAASVISYDESTALRHADLLAQVRRMGRPRGAHDLMVAATAAASGRTLVTTDACAFTDLPGISVSVV